MLRLKRLSTQIYLTMLAALIAFVAVTAITWKRALEGPPVREALEISGELLAAALPPATAPDAVQAEAAQKLAQRLGVDLALHAADRHLITRVGEALPPPPEDDRDGGFMGGRFGPAWAVPLPDGRWLIARLRRIGPPRPALRVLLFLGGIALIIGLTAFPIVRGLTRRLEALNDGVERLGQGDLGARVDVAGRDEVARLAASFNRSAARVEELVSAHKMLLANASHELRTPLARIRLGLELVANGGAVEPQRWAALKSDIAELDGLIEELLLLSRLDAIERLDQVVDVDLLGLAAEEAARYPRTDVSGAAVVVKGDPRLLRHMLRNLIDNAVKHGVPPITVRIASAGGEAVLTVGDGGGGVEAELADSLFEPFQRGAHSRGRVKGSGLGLAIVRQIARRHGGTARFVAGAGGRLNAIEVRLRRNAN
ncbi:MAG: ATP-binding protein [Hyphomicrobiaceae bacterium]|nr:ATP-binding protein [Hyphomicrobiaceae bacterium]